MMLHTYQKFIGSHPSSRMSTDEKYECMWLLIDESGTTKIERRYGALTKPKYLRPLKVENPYEPLEIFEPDESFDKIAPPPAYLDKEVLTNEDPVKRLIRLGFLSPNYLRDDLTEMDIWWKAYYILCYAESLQDIKYVFNSSYYMDVLKDDLEDELVVFDRYPEKYWLKLIHKLAPQIETMRFKKKDVVRNWKEIQEMEDPPDLPNLSTMSKAELELRLSGTQDNRITIPGRPEFQLRLDEPTKENLRALRDQLVDKSVLGQPTVVLRKAREVNRMAEMLTNSALSPKTKQPPDPKGKPEGTKRKARRGRRRKP
jgi:hypothetical protein